MAADAVQIQGFTAHFVGEPGVRDSIKFTRDSDSREVAMIVEMLCSKILDGCDGGIESLEYSSWQVWLCMPYGTWTIGDCPPYYESKAQALEYVELLLKAKAFDWVTPSDYVDPQENFASVFYAPKDRSHRAILLGIILEDRNDGQTNPARLEYAGKIEYHENYNKCLKSLVRHYALPENQLP